MYFKDDINIDTTQALRELELSKENVFVPVSYVHILDFDNQLNEE